MQAYMAAMPGWKQDVGRRLDDLIEKAVPGVQKAVRWNSPFYGVADRGWFASHHWFTRYVKLTFFAGATLDPEPPERSKDEQARQLHVREDEQIDIAALSEWVREAAALPGWDGF